MHALIMLDTYLLHPFLCTKKNHAVTCIILNILSIESQKGVIAIQQCSIENQKGAITAQRLYGGSNLLVLNGTSLKNTNAFLVVSRQLFQVFVLLEVTKRN